MNADLKSRAIALIAENLGEVAAKAYRDFYADKADEIVVKSVREILVEIIGERKAEEKMKILLI